MDKMKRKKWTAVLLAAGMTISLAGNPAVYSFEDDLPEYNFDDDFIDDLPGDNNSPGYLEGDEPVDTPSTDAPATDAPSTDAPETEPPATDAPATDAPATEPPATEPPATEPPETEPPATEPPATDAPETEPPVVNTPATDAPVYQPPATEPYYDNTPVTEAYEPEYYEEDDYDEGYDEEDDYDEDLEDADGESEENTDESTGALTIDDFEILDVEAARAAFNLPAKSELPSQMYLKVPDILQLPELPTGCEATALTMVLQYEDFVVDKETVAWEYMLYNEEDDNAARGYVGDPSAEDGAGCFAPALTASAEHYFVANEVAYRAYDVTDSTMDELCAYVASGTPVIVWTTMGMEEPEFTEEGGGEYNERKYPWYRQEHCVVLSGYNFDEGTVQVNDPLDGIVSRDLATFQSIYEKTGQNAVIVKKTEETAKKKKKKKKKKKQQETTAETVTEETAATVSEESETVVDGQ